VFNNLFKTGQLAAGLRQCIDQRLPLYT